MRIFPKKISIRLIILLSFLFVSILGLIKIIYEENKPSRHGLISLSTPHPTSLPTPTPIIRSFSGIRQNILVTIPKYHDNSDEKETYEISFDKVSASSGFYLINKGLPSLEILDKNYEFSVLLAKEMAGNPEELDKTFTEVNTNQFGTLKKIVVKAGPGNEITYKYFTDSYTVKIFPEQKEMPSQAFISCHIMGEDKGECDKLISTISIKLK